VPPIDVAARLLPAPLPQDRGGRLLLLALRRMGAHGLHDAATAQHYLAALGQHFRRPLLMTRIAVHEVSAAAMTPIQIAPCCCPRLTAAESGLLGAAASALANPDRARLLLGDLLATRHPDGALAALTAAATAYRDCGLPIGGWR